MSEDDNKQKTQPDSHQGTGFLNTIKSVAMAFIGIQSSKNQERDFAKGKASDFIIIGVIMTLLFVLVVYNIVSSAVEEAGF